MKKTVTVNISGIVFTLDDDAFKKLQNYLDTIKSYFSKSEGRDEIMADIETRIAEMFVQRMGNQREVVNISDIDDIISRLGQPEDFKSAAEEAHAENNNSYTDHGGSTYTQTHRRFKKRLYRDPDNRVIGGVCAGIAHYFGIDPVWIRLALALAVIFGGTGILIYILFWIIVPQANTTAEKLEMKGEPVTIDSIGKSVEQEMGYVKKNFDNYRSSESQGQWQEKTRSFFDDIIDFLGRAFGLFFRVLGKVIGVVLLIGGVVGLFALIAGLIGFGTVGSPIIMHDVHGLDGFSFVELEQLFFRDTFDAWVAVTGILLIAGIPILAVAYAGYAILIAPGKPSGRFGWSILGLWLLGLLMTVYSGFATADSFSRSGRFNSVAELENSSDTLKIAFEKSIHDETHYPDERQELYVYMTDEWRYVNRIDFDIHEATGSIPRVEFTHMARGNSTSDAEDRAENIHYEWKMEDGLLDFSPVFAFSSEDKWRNQRILIDLFIPQGMTIYLDESCADFLDDVENVSHTYDPHMVNHYWTMTSRGLKSEAFEMIETELDEEFESANNEYLEIQADLDEGEIQIRKSAD